MDLTTIILILIIVLQLVVLAVLYRNRSNAVDESDLLEIVRQFEATERRMYEGLRDLRNEQATLARAARLENQSTADRLSEQLDKRFDKIGASTEKNLEQIRLILEHLQSEFVPADGPQITPHSAERLLRLLDKDFNFSQKVLAPEPMLVFLPDCGHRTYDAFCVPYLCRFTMQVQQ